MQGKDNDLPNDELEQPNGIIINIDEHCKVMVEDIVQYIVVNETSCVSISTQKDIEDMQNETDIEEHEHMQLMVKDKSEVGA